MTTVTIFLVLVVFFASVNAQIVAPPTIQGVNYVSENEASITWTTTDQTNPSRFRIQITAEREIPWISEWPAQIKRVDYDSEEPSYKQQATESNFECFNLCIQEPDCAFVVRSSNPIGNNCFFKKNASKVTNTTLDPDSEYGLVEPYSSTNSIKYLSSNEDYKIKVSVYDSVVKQWSNFSVYVYYTLRNRFLITFTRSGVYEGSLNWQEFRPVTYSRFSLVLSVNQSEYSELKLNTTSLETFEHPTGYFSIEDYSKFKVTANEKSCINECFNQFDCVQLVYFSEDFISDNGAKIASKNSCYLNKQLLLINGIYRKSNTTVLNVKDTRSSYHLSDLDFGSWNFMLGTRSQYGIEFSSNALASYNITDASPVLENANIGAFINVTWQMPEPLSVKRAAFYYTINDSSNYNYLISLSTDFNDPEQKTINVSNFNQCFEACYQSQACSAYSYISLRGVCFLKTNTDQPIACTEEAICGVIAGTVKFDFSIYPFINTLYCFYAYATTTFDYTTPPGRLICANKRGSVMIERITPFVAGYRGQLYCLPQENNNQINWYHNLLPLNFSALDAQLSNDKTSITFYNISGRLHNGVYSCENILGNGQVVQSIDNALVSVVEPPPSTMFYSEAHLLGPKASQTFLIEFYIDPFLLPVECIILFYRNDTLTESRNKTYCSKTLRGGTIVIYDPDELNDICSYTFKIRAINSVGSSPSSSAFSIPKSQCEENEPPEVKTHTYYGLFVASVSLAAVFLVVIVILVIQKAKARQVFHENTSL